MKEINTDKQAMIAAGNLILQMAEALQGFDEYGDLEFEVESAKEMAAMLLEEGAKTK